MINEGQNTPGPDDLGDDTDIAATQDYDAPDPLGEVSESDDDAQGSDEADVQTEDNFDEEGNVINEYSNNGIDDMSDES